MRIPSSSTKVAYRRRRWIIAFWAVFLVVGFMVGGKVFAHLDDSGGGSSSESVRGMQLLDASSDNGSTVVVLVDHVPVASPDTERAITSATAALHRLPYVQAVHSPYGPGGERLRASDGQAVALTVDVPQTKRMTDAADRDQDIRKAVTSAVEPVLSSAHVSIGGSGALMVDQMNTSSNDLMRGEMIALPVLLVALVLVFRGLRPALLRLAAAVVTVSGALLLLLVATTVTAVASYAVAGRALRLRQRHLRSLALGGIATVVVAMAAGVTLVPALLGSMGRKIRFSDVNVREDGRFARVARRCSASPCSSSSVSRQSWR